ncbi:MAG TPA: phospho-N-acetylmuramoyl-pentapeptide-transferase [Gemmatimonadales bacterium]
MLYELLLSLADKFHILNLLSYITFRAAAGAATGFFLSLAIAPAVIRQLKARGVAQVIRSDGPASHQGKRGTPTMGGLIILIPTILASLMWARFDFNRYVIVAIGGTAWMGLIGFVDDYLKVVQGKSRGLIARYKLVGQVTFGVALGAFLLRSPLAANVPANATTLPFFKYLLIVLPPFLYLVWVTFIVTGFSNAVNLTDGLDGLATGLTVIAAAAFAVFAYLFGRRDASAYLLVYYLPGAGELAVFCAALAGATLGFLWYNAHPAQIFMGDTGSLGIGGALGTVAVLLKSEFLLLLVGGVFVAETASVIIQTGAFRWRVRRHGRAYAEQHRVFRMAPLHHHFEKLGWAESTIVTRFWIIGILCALFALSTLKIR